MTFRVLPPIVVCVSNAFSSEVTTDKECFQNTFIIYSNEEEHLVTSICGADARRDGVINVDIVTFPIQGIVSWQGTPKHEHLNHVGLDNQLLCVNLSYVPGDIIFRNGYSGVQSRVVAVQRYVSFGKEENHFQRVKHRRRKNCRRP